VAAFSVANNCDQSAGHATNAQVFSTNPVPLETEGDHLYVRARVNDRELRLLLDTGASHVLITPEAAATAGIQKNMKTRIAGFVDDRTLGHATVADSIVIGPATAEKVPAFIMPIPALFGADGVLGVSFLEEFIFRLDYDRKLLSFTSRTSSKLTGGGVSIPLESKRRLLTVVAEVDGIPAKLIVDTGAGQSLILNSWFVEKHNLRERNPKRLKIITGQGFLGETRGEIVRLRTLKLGDYTVTNVFAEFETKTNIAPRTIAGFVGTLFLRRFNLTFDVAEGRLWIEPNSRYEIEPPVPASMRSGLVFKPEGTNYIVWDTVPHSPASEAGICVGDRLLELNGVSVESLKFARIKDAFRADAGTRVRLRLQAKDRPEREVSLTLRDLL